MPEEQVEAFAGLVDELAEMVLAGNVEVAQIEQRGRQRLAAEVGRLVEHDEAREMDAVKGAEVDHRSVRDSVAHRLEELLQASGLSRPDLGDERQCDLMRHRASVLRRQREVQDPVAPPEDKPEVNAG